MMIFHVFLMFFVCLPEAKSTSINIYNIYINKYLSNFIIIFLYIIIRSSWKCMTLRQRINTTPQCRSPRLLQESLRRNGPPRNVSFGSGKFTVVSRESYYMRNFITTITIGGCSYGCIKIYIYMYLYIYICIHTYIYIYIYMYIYMCIYI